MSKLSILKSALIGGASAVAIVTGASAHDFNIPAGDLGAALHEFTSQAGIALVVSGDAVKGVRTHGANGDLSADMALSRILRDTGFKAQTDLGVIAIVRDHKKTSEAAEPVTRLAENGAAPVHAATSVETVVVTSSKIKGDIQTVPIAITALSQEQLTSRQIAGGPDLVKEVPNLTFSKTNFTGYNIEIRGIGTQAISATTDPAVAVAMNDIPFIRNHFFEQEFFDVSQVLVLRGPQGTLYGRNATAGVVNVITAKPTDQFEAMLSADWGNYTNRRYEGMINIPIVDDRLDLRLAGEWTKRDGYSFNTVTNQPIDGRDLWSSRVTLQWKPVQSVTADLIWEHFNENDDRMRTAKQLCTTDVPPAEVGGYATETNPIGSLAAGNMLSQGCKMGSLYGKDAFQEPYAYSLQYYGLLLILTPQLRNFNIYAEPQSTNLRDIQAQINPHYRAKNDTVELNIDYNLSPLLTFTSQSGYNSDFLLSTEDYNRFNSPPGAFVYNPSDLNVQHGLVIPDPAAGTNGIPSDSALFCDPQLGCSDRIIAQDLSEEHAWQLSQEFRLASHFTGPLNFSIGANYLHYETEENYFVFINTVSMFDIRQVLIDERNSDAQYLPGVPMGSACLLRGFQTTQPLSPHNNKLLIGGNCAYYDPNPLGNLNGQGHNYFVSKNPYTLNSYAGFGEVYYNLTKDLKLTGGLRWTDDQKHFLDIPSEILVPGYGYPVTGVIDQQWQKFTGRGVINWTPHLPFTDQSMFYASYSRGYKAGGANPPPAHFASSCNVPRDRGCDAFVGLTDPIHPLTFKPEFVNAYELGTKNTMLDGGLTFDGDVFYYDYKGYQISRIVDRTAINDNFNAKVEGAELEASYEPIPGLKFNFASGYEHTRVDNGQSSVDLMDRTAGNPDWMVVKPSALEASNCILPAYVIAAKLEQNILARGISGSGLSPINNSPCDVTYVDHLDPITNLPYILSPTVSTNLGGGSSPKPPIPTGYQGFDPSTAPNNGEGFAKDLSGNELPNAPHFTTSFSADYTMPVSEDWAATFHTDFYWQSQSWARIFNDRPYDKIRGYSNVNLALILTSASGWQVMGYLKNVFDTTAITGDFLNSDDTGLTTNVFLTDPRLFGVRVTKNW